MNPTLSLIDRLKSQIVDVPDFPKEGIIFKDITPILADPALIEETVKDLAEYYSDWNLDAIAGIESRGFLFGIQLARHMSLPFIPIRKEGKLPREKVRVAYQLEYGSTEMFQFSPAI